MSKTPNSELYDQDFFEWTRATAELVRSGKWAELDPEHVAEELESVGLRDKREVVSRLKVLIMHLLKWQVQPNERSRSWSLTIATHRSDLEDVFRDSPSLRARLPRWVNEAYPGSVKKAVDEMQLLRNPFPSVCPFTPEAIMAEDWLPNGKDAA